MRKSYLKWSVLGTSLILALNACSPDEAKEMTPELNQEFESIPDLVVGSENFRTIPTAYNYHEEFDNQIFYIPLDGLSFPEGLYPGTGKGVATRTGKGNSSMSFINQLATFDSDFNLVTKGAPVTDVFADELTDCGLSGIPNEVSSVTTDGKGNAIWFETVENFTFPVGPDRVNFSAKVKIIGGSGRFAKAFGEGVVEGYFNPNNGQGKSKTSARINF
jgi:hypothetical protein